jgi:hypothetical protein
LEIAHDFARQRLAYQLGWLGGNRVASSGPAFAQRAAVGSITLHSASIP